MDTPRNFEQEIERCDREIARIEAELRAGHPEMEGLLLGLHDWAHEKRFLEAKRDAHRD
jgi:hypothetical protein